MNNVNNLVIRKSTKSEDSIIAQHFYQLWLDNEVTVENIRQNWLEETLNFIDRARQELFKHLVSKE